MLIFLITGAHFDQLDEVCQIFFPLKSFYFIPLQLCEYSFPLQTLTHYLWHPFTIFCLNQLLL